MDAYKSVSDRVKVTEKTVRNWVADFELLTIVRGSNRGKHSKTISPNQGQPRVQSFVQRFCKI